MHQGDRIKKFGREWVVLDTEYPIAEGTGVLLQATEIWTYRRFDKKHNYYPNSEIKKFLEECSEELGSNFGTVKLSMLADDGTGWEEPDFEVKGLFLLAEDMYRKYRRWIPKLPDWWWLSTASNFYYAKHSESSRRIRCVDTGGALDNDYAYVGYIGLAPALVILN